MLAIPEELCLPLLDVTEDAQELDQEHLQANEKRNIQPCNFCCQAPVSDVLGVVAATSLVRLRLVGVFEGSEQKLSMTQLETRDFGFLFSR